jgi:ABC-type Na+ efflux pump permease subunit
MSFSINPNTVYYLLIYTIILVLRFFKIYRDIRRGIAGRNWRHYFFVGLELVYSSAGIVILLLTAIPLWASVIIMSYIVLLLVAAFLDAMGEDFPEGQRLKANVAIILIVIILSISFNQTVLFSKATQLSGTSTKQAAIPHEYTVAIPYSDYTLRKYVGERLGNRMLVFSTTVTATDRDEAVRAAKRVFWDDKNEDVTPFDQKRTKTPQNILVDGDRIVVEART